MSELWINNPNVLFESNVIYPSAGSELNDCLNAITRLVMLITISMSFMRKNSRFILLGLTGSYILTRIISEQYDVETTSKQEPKQEPVQEIFQNFNEKHDDYDRVHTFAHAVYGSINSGEKLYVR